MSTGKRIIRLLGQRALQGVLVAVFVGTLSFFMLRSLPGDLAYRVAAARYGYDMVSTAAADAVRAELGLDRPWWSALMSWWTDLLSFDLGTSLVSGEPVTHALAHELGHTVMLALVAIALSALIALPIGVLAGLRPNGWLDRSALAVSVALRALPPFLLGLLIVLLFSVQLGAFPAAGHGEHGNLFLPALTLALGLAAVSSRVVRDAMADVVASPYFAFALTKGLSEGRALLRHGLRNVGVPAVAYLGVQTVFLIEGVVVVETLFAWPGIGHALVHAIFGRDVPMLQGTVLTLALLFVAFNALIDLACLAIDPRQRNAP